MSLVQCKECSKEVSDKAVSCPHCGAPVVGAAESRAAGARLTTTQGTSKKLKLQSVLSSALMLIGIVWLSMTLVAAEGGAVNDASTEMIILAVGLTWHLVTRLRIWWHHE